MRERLGETRRWLFSFVPKYASGSCKREPFECVETAGEDQREMDFKETISKGNSTVKVQGNTRSTIVQYSKKSTLPLSVLLQILFNYL